MRSKPTLRTTGWGIFLAGLVTFLLSTVFTSGFVHGLFQGMTVALMLGAAYLFGAHWRHGRPGGGDVESSEALWLPSRDERRE
ncbi:MAG: hypothetical protein ABJH68_14770 [Ilumatobacter sp.]|uniref:hypothetical protein n=1 Tax=Ilumatobacter sp. TaxID=1967498 RepID=UPI0032984912